jgi:hypothetical protein
MATEDYSDLYEAAGHKHNVDPALLRVIVHQESHGNANTPDSPKGAKGLAQITGPTAKGLGVDPYNPAQAIDGAAQLISESLDRNNGDVGQAVAEYHGGPNRKIWGPKTAAYQKEVLAAYQSAQDNPTTPQAASSDDDILAMASGEKPAGGSTSQATRSDDDVLKLASGGDTSSGPQFISYKEASDPQKKFIAEQIKGGVHDESQPVGSAAHPYFESADHPLSATPPGAYVVDAKTGALHRMPGGEKESSVGAGLAQGVGDAAASIAHMVPGSDDSTLKNALLAGQKVYGAKYGGDTASGLGRFTGQVVGSAPLLAAGEGLAAPVLENAGAVGTFLAGNAGKGLTGIERLLTRGGSLAAKSAQVGAGGAALTSSANEGSVGRQMAEGAVGGAILGPAAPAIEGAGGAVARGVKNLVQPLNAEGRTQIANKIVQGFSAGPVGDVNAGEIIPGSVPTHAMASADPGIATLERTVRLGEHGPKFTARDAQNANARGEFLDALRGDEQHISDLTDVRETATKGAREAALAGQTKPANVKPVLDTIDGILKGPEGKRSEVVKALNEIRTNLLDAKGKPETDAAMLYGVRKSIDDLLSPKASSEKSGAKLAASQLVTVKKALDDSIQAVAPGFKEYLANYSKLSKPIDEARWLQQQKLTDVNGNPTLAKVQAAIERITAQRTKPGVNDAKSISAETINKLTALRDDLKRSGNLTLQKPGGSDTAQHLTTGGRLQAAGIPASVGLAMAHHPVLGAAMGAGRLLYGMKDKQIMAEVANRLLNPEAVPVKPAVAQAKAGLLKRLQGVVPAAAGGIIANRMVPAQ